MSAGEQRTIHAGNHWSEAVTVGGEWLLRPLGFKRRVVPHMGIDIEVLEGRGRGGPDLVFIHGLGDRNSTWHRVLWRLRRGPWGRIIAPDLVGFGRTVLPEGQGFPEMEEGVRIMHQFVSRLTDQPPIVIGNSLGGWLAWRLLTTFPTDIAGLLLLAPAGFMDVAELKHLTGRFITGERGEMTRAIMQDARPEIRFFALRIIGHMLGSPLIVDICTQDSRHMLCKPGELKPYANRVRCLWGDRDTLMPDSGPEHLKRELGSHLVIDQVGHAPQQTRPGMVVRELVKLAAQISQKRLAGPDVLPNHQGDGLEVAPAPQTHS
jgi:pimeloyl-ACP methyl ester carboxylesterase